MEASSPKEWAKALDPTKGAGYSREAESRVEKAEKAKRNKFLAVIGPGGVSRDGQGRPSYGFASLPPPGPITARKKFRPWVYSVFFHCLLLLWITLLPVIASKSFERDLSHVEMVSTPLSIPPPPTPLAVPPREWEEPNEMVLVEPAPTPEEVNPSEEKPVAETVVYAEARAASPDSLAVEAAQGFRPKKGIHQEVAVPQAVGPRPSVPEKAPVTVPFVARTSGEGEGLTRGALLKGRIVPVFPAGRVRAGQAASVSLLVKIDARGQVAEVEVLTPEAHEDFIRAALAAVREAPFGPALLRGRPVAGQVRVKIEFKLVN